MRSNISFSPYLSELKQVMGWIYKQAIAAGFVQPEVRRIELAMEEALVNIIEHAHLATDDLIELICHISEEGRCIEFIIKDPGEPFNPINAIKEPNPSESLEHKAEGGLGLFMIRKFMDHLFYERKGTYNILHLQKRRVRLQR